MIDHSLALKSSLAEPIDKKEEQQLKTKEKKLLKIERNLNRLP